jgi:hypothetical protein
LSLQAKKIDQDGTIANRQIDTGLQTKQAELSVAERTKDKELNFAERSKAADMGVKSKELGLSETKLKNDAKAAGITKKKRTLTPQRDAKGLITKVIETEEDDE